MPIHNPVSDDLFIASSRPNRKRMLFFIHSYTYTIAILISAILFFSLADKDPLYLLVIPLYWIYVALKLFYQKRDEWSRYYKSKNLQFLRALFLIAVTTVFLYFMYRSFPSFQNLNNDNLWLLYLIAIYVVSQRGSTNLFGVTLVVVNIALYIVEPKGGLGLVSFLGFDFTLSFISKSIWLFLLSIIFYIFIRHMADTIADLNLIIKVQDKLREMESMLINKNIDFNRNAYLEQVVEMISSDFKYDHVNIFRVSTDDSHATYVAAACQKGKELVSQKYSIDLINEKSIIRQAVINRKTYLANNVNNDNYYLRHSAFPDTKAELVVPINTMNGVYGVLDVQVHLSSYFLDQDLSAIEILANHIGWIIDNTRQIKQIDSINRIIRNIADPIFTQNDLDETLREIADAAYRELKADLVVLYSFDPEDEKFIGPIYSGQAYYPEMLLTSQSDRDNIIHRVLTKDEVLYLFDDLRALDIKTHPLFSPSTQHQLSGKLSFIEREQISANVIIPLMDDKDFVGILFLNYRKPQSFSQWDKERYFTFAHLAALGIQKMQFYNRMIKFEMRDLADRVHDALIGDALGLLKTLESIKIPQQGTEWEKIKERVEIAKDMTDRLYNDIRYVKNVLDLDISDDLRLDIDRLATLYRQAYRVEISQRWEGNPEQIPIKWIYAIRYIIREAIANSIHRGKAHYIEVNANVGSNSFDLVIIDDGKGFVLEKLTRTNGLKNMRERVNKLGGEFKIESQLQVGTIIKASFPFVYMEK